MFTKTPEQEKINEIAKTGIDIIIQAFAGTGKTSTLKVLSKESLKLKTSLYIAFNKTIAEEAKQSFPEWVDCRTVHSLAYQAIVRGTGYGKKGRLVGYYDYKEITASLSSLLSNYSEDEAFLIVGNIVELIKEFCQSADFKLCDFVPAYIDGREEFCSISEVPYIDMCKHVWEQMVKLNGGIKITHDIYLKLYQLSKPDLSKDYQVIYLDEMQDSNPVTLDIFFRQKDKCQLIGVGDKFQGIYAWRGAHNAMSSIDEDASFTILPLTYNFRFNQSLADKANILLSYMGADNTIKGLGTKTTVDNEAVLVRTNFTLFNRLIQAYNEQKKVFAVADLKDLFSQIYTARALMFTKKGDKPNYGLYPHKKIASFNSYAELCKSKEPEIIRLVKLLNSVPDMHQTIVNIKSILVESEEEADLVLVTGHKSKGREWDKVTLTNDFLPRIDEDSDDSWEEILQQFIDCQGMNLCYVAMTRARVELVLTEEWESFLLTLTY